MRSRRGRRTLRLGTNPVWVFQIPAAAKRFVKLNYDSAAIEFRLSQSDLSGKELLLGLENFVIAGFTSDVSLKGYFDRLLGGLDSFVLLFSNGIILLA